MVLICVAPNIGSSAPTTSQKSATSLAACSSPCASVSAVNPAISANMNVEQTASGSSVTRLVVQSAINRSDGSKRRSPALQACQPRDQGGLSEVCESNAHWGDFIDGSELRPGRWTFSGCPADATSPRRSRASGEPASVLAPSPPRYPTASMAAITAVSSVLLCCDPDQPCLGVDDDRFDSIRAGELFDDRSPAGRC